VCYVLLSHPKMHQNYVWQPGSVRTRCVVELAALSRPIAGLREGTWKEVRGRGRREAEEKNGKRAKKRKERGGEFGGGSLNPS